MCSTTTLTVLVACVTMALACNPDYLHTTISPVAQTTTPAAQIVTSGNNAEQEAIKAMLQKIIDQQKEMETKVTKLEEDVNRCPIANEVRDAAGKCVCSAPNVQNAAKTECNKP